VSIEVVTELSDSMEEPAQFVKLIRRVFGSQSANQSYDLELFGMFAEFRKHNSNGMKKYNF